jgi:hypothetical protein
MRLRDRLPNYLRTADITDIELAADYVISLDGVNYNALNGTTGVIDFTSTSAHTVINAAIAALTRGRVYLKTDVALTAGIAGKANIILDCGMHKLTPATSFNMVTMKPGFQLRNFVFDVSGLAFTDTCIYFDGADSYAGVGAGINKNTMVVNGYAYSAAQSGRFIWMDCDAADHNVIFVTVDNVMTYRFQYAFYLEASQDIDTCFINGNSFHRIMGWGDAYFIYMTRAAAASIDANDFINIDYQRQAGTIDAVTINGNFNNIQGTIWDIILPQKAIVFNASAEHNLATLQNTTAATCTFAGNYNQVFLQRNHGFTGSSDVYFFYGSGTNKTLYIYGDVAGVDKYMSLAVSNSGTGTVSAQGGYGLHLTSDTSLDFNRYAGANARCFYGCGEDTNKLFLVYGRNAANNASHYTFVKWGDATLDHGIIGTDVGDLKLEPATDIVRFGTHTGGGDTVSNGYITIKDSAGNTRKLMTTA